MDAARVLLFAVSAGALYAGAWRCTARLLRGTVEEHVLGTMVLGTFSALVMLRALGGLALLWDVPLVVAALAIGAALAWWGRGAPSPVLPPSRPDALLHGGVLAIALLCVLLVGQAWIYRTTAWDALWYHATITHAYVAQGSTHWLDIGVPEASGYADAVELLAAWPCAVIRTTTFDDAPQLPFGLLGAALVAAWSRRAGASRGIAATFAAIWMAMPPVVLQLTANLSDVALGTAIAATFYFLAVAGRGPGRSHFVLMSACLALATKGSALLLLLPLGPFLVADQLTGLWQSRGAPARMLVDLGARVATLAGIGLIKPIENAIVTGNPVYPFRRVLLGHELEGPVDPAAITWSGMHGLDAFFFAGEGDALRMITSWYDFDPGYEPCVRSGGFGVVHAFIGVPCLLAALLMCARQGWRRHAPLAMALGLFLLGIQGSNPWWPRFILAASVASMVAAAAMVSRARRAGRALTLVAALAASAHLAVAVTRGLESFREHGVSAVLALPPEERAALALGPIWPAEMTIDRDVTLGRGEALAYEQSVWLVGQFFPWDYRSRLAWVEPEGNGEAYLQRLRAANARWVVLRTPRYVRALEALGARERHRNGDEIVLELPSP